MRIQTRATRATTGATLIALAALAGSALVLFASLISPSSALAAEGNVTFVECLKDTGSGSTCSDGGATVITSLNNPNDVVASPDGKHIYVASILDDSLTAFARNPVTGTLSYVDFAKDGFLGVDGLDGADGVTISPDGRHVYVASNGDDAVTTFSRDPATGAIDFVEMDKDDVGVVDGLDDASSVTTSPDGMNVYVAGFLDDAVATFTRNPATGGLDFVEALKSSDSGGTVMDGLDGASGVTTSPDGRSVYVAAQTDDTLAVFARDPDTGTLDLVETEKDGFNGVDGLDVAIAVRASPDGRHVYVASFFDDAITTFATNTATGGLDFVQALKNGFGGVEGINGAAEVSISPDGKHAYVAGSVGDTLATFTRNPANGALAFLEVEEDGVAGVDGLDGARGITTSPDGAHVYVAGQQDDAVATFAREADVTPPETTIDSGPTGNTTDPAPSFGFSSDDPGFTAGFECRIDGGPFISCTSPAAIGLLGRGPHTFEVRATDTAGNTDPSPALRGFAVIAATPPPPPPPPPTPPPTACPAKTLKTGKLIRNQQKGIARLKVKAGGKGRVILRGSRKVKKSVTKVGASGRGKLRIKARGRSVRKLRQRGKARVKVKLFYRPGGDCPNGKKTRNIKLVRKR